MWCGPTRRSSGFRLVTGRPAIMVFHGAYHGGVFYFGQHKTEINAPFPWIYADYNDVMALEKRVRARAQSGEL